MKNLFITSSLLLGIMSVSYSNTIELQTKNTSDSKNCSEIGITENSLNENLSDKTIFPIAALVALVQKIDDCNQVQMDVAASYEPRFGVDVANSMALGAFMGCMGYL